MKFVDTSNKLPIKSWCEPVEPGAMKQARNLANHPAVFKQVALMPDCHQGYGMPIGGVIACQRAVVPNAVGVDIGCGMCAVRTSLHELDRTRLKRILCVVRDRIPVGFKHRTQKVSPARMPAPEERDAPMPIVRRELENARTQLGTLGGGNHFIELQRDTEGCIWVMVHSGSRNLGKQVADHYNRAAVTIDRARRSPLPKDWQLAYLDIDTPQARSYLAEMQYCVDFALANRRYMMEIVMAALSEELGGAVSFETIINIAHNYAAHESHFGRQVWVHRKGATLARKGTTGIVPGSQGTNSYIVRGLGNPESFESCSHGAGRKLGRKQAQRTLDLHAERRKLDDVGILHSIRTCGDLDEAAGAYKDIADVMRLQRDLVEILVELRPLAVIKG